MAGNSFGKAFVVTTYGESHGQSIGAIIDGCPPGIGINLEEIQHELNRRRPGQSDIVSPRNESDQIQIASGILNGYTTGTPIHLFINNNDFRKNDYTHLEKSYRPSHADFTYEAKYGVRDYSGGGRSSARETAARVAAGAIAKQILQKFDISILAWVSQVGPIALTDTYDWTIAQIESTPVRCPDTPTAHKMMAYIEDIKKAGDTTGGIISCNITGCPPGLGEPVFDKLHADLAKAMLSINAVKGFEYGSGFQSASMLGSEHNDSFIMEDHQVKTKTNHSGGIQGGITNGMPVYFKVAFKPVSTVLQDQWTIDSDGNEIKLEGKGRHDPCVVPRAVPIVESMGALVLVDHLLRQEIYKIKK